MTYNELLISYPASLISLLLTYFLLSYLPSFPSWFFLSLRASYFPWFLQSFLASFLLCLLPKFFTFFYHHYLYFVVTHSLLQLVLQSSSLCFSLQLRQNLTPRFLLLLGFFAFSLSSSVIFSSAPFCPSCALLNLSFLSFSHSGCCPWSSSLYL